MCLVRRIIANLRPIMIHFHALDFNVCRSEEVMFLLTLNVDQNYTTTHLPKIRNGQKYTIHVDQGGQPGSFSQRTESCNSLVDENIHQSQLLRMECI